MVKKYSLLLFIWTFGACFAFGQQTSFRITTDTWYLDGQNDLYQDVDPGDTLFFESGNREYILLKNFQGTEDKPIVFINDGGEVIIDTDHYFGISIQNCRYIKFTGTGDSTQMYGFKVKRVANGAGMGIGYQSSDFEIDHVSIENCLIGGIYAKTDPDCDGTSVRGAFTQYNTLIHDNYIANAGNEGMYIGSTKYNGQTITCDGKDTLLYPGFLEGVRVYNNIVKYSGWDGIQVSSASDDCLIYNNTVLYDSQEEVGNQMSGIIIGGGSKCDCYNNFIAEGKGNGIESHGLGGYTIFNNIIVNAGLSYLPDELTSFKYGIFVTDISVAADSAFYILHNDIINPKSDGIRFYSQKSANNIISSNVIVNPGNFDYYENGDTRFSGIDSYVMISFTDSKVTSTNNYFTRDISDVGFLMDETLSPSYYQLTEDSPLINQVDLNSKVTFDFEGTPRPIGSRSDIGAWESDFLGSNTIKIEDKTNQSLLLGNPVSNYLVIKLLSATDKNTSIDIFTIEGQLVQHFSSFDSQAENQIVRISIAALSSGLYFYKINWNSISETGKFLKK